MSTTKENPPLGRGTTEPPPLGDPPAVPADLSLVSGADDAPLQCLLIHGTWSCEHDFTDAMALLTSGLRKLKPGQVAIRSFSWSGHNDHEERVYAARELTACLEHEAARLPSSRFLLVGHSHGGNIALHAVRAIPEKQRVGVVCLGTPFIHVRKRSTTAGYWLAAGAALLLAGLFWWGMATFATSALERGGIFALINKANHWLVDVLPGGHFVAKVTAAIRGPLVALATALVVIAWTLMMIVAFKSSAQDKAFNRWVRLQPHATRVLCLFFGPDEVYVGIRFLRLFGEGLHRATAWFADRLMPPASVMVVIATAASSSYFAINTPDWLLARIGAEHVVGRTAMMVGAAIVATILALWLLTALASTLNLIGFGSRRLRDHFWLDLHIQRIPQLAAGEICRREIPLHGQGFLSALRAIVPILWGSLFHSRVYLDPRAPQIIAEWYRADEARCGP